MATLLHPAPGEEARRLDEARAALDRTHELAVRGGQLTAGIFAAAGVGDWGDAQPYARGIAFACRLCRGARSLDAFHRLIAHLEARAGRLLHRSDRDRSLHPLLVLQQLAEEHPRWRREPAEWRPRSAPAPRQLADLIHHLLGREDAASFTAELSSLEPPALVQRLFGHLNRGENNRPDAPRPLYLTRRMGLQFLQAPGRYDLIRALRWGQVYGLGGTGTRGAGGRLARAIDFTRLAWQIGEPLDEEFWVGLFQWFANQPELDAEHVTPIVDYVHAMHYGDPSIEQPPSPTFTMEGRAPAALLRLVEGWHREIAGRRDFVHAEFRPSGVKSGRWEIEVDGRPQIWTVDEILDSTTLRDEGRKMRHCVGSYLEAIEKGKCSVWSMKSRRGDLVRRATTIQLNLASRRIVQCRGPCNRQPLSIEKRVLKLWAQENGLSASL